MTGGPEIVRLTRVGSTMDALHELAEAGAPAGTAVAAEEQITARGSRGRRWWSPPGGLWVSVLARPAVAGVEVLSLRAGLAVAELLDRLGARRPIALKWPNDLMLDGRKTGGILCEARWQGQALGWVAIGLGVNVTNRPASGLEDAATRLAEALPDVGPEALLVPVIEALRTVDAGAGHLSDEECVRFARRDWLRGRALEAPVPGTALGVAPDGALLVRHPDGGTIAVRAGSVVLAEKAVTENLRPCS